jgi:dTDP-4-amino-4,6-dideoxygalactose transaminase
LTATNIGHVPVAPKSADGVPFTKLDNSDPELFAELLSRVEDVARRAAFTLGEEVESFESAFASYCGADAAIGVSSGTDALALTLRAMDIGPGDVVIVPTNSFIATAEAVSLAGATPRFVDVDPTTANMTAETVAGSIDDKVRAIIPVHLYGRTVDLDPIVSLARDAGIKVIEDACQAHGAVYRGKRAGSIGDAGCFSFYPAKNLGAWGDGGAVVTSDPELEDRIRLMRSHGERPRYTHRIVGTTGRLDSMQAAILRVKLDRLEGWNDGRRDAAKRLTGVLSETSLDLPAAAGEGQDHVFHLYVVGSDKRDALRAHLAGNDIATGIHYPAPIHRAPAYAGLGTGELPVAERLAERALTLPLFPGMSDREIQTIGAAVLAFED